MASTPGACKYVLLSLCVYDTPLVCFQPLSLLVLRPSISCSRCQRQSRLFSRLFLQVGLHVEEDSTGWMPAFNLALSLLSFVVSFTENAFKVGSL